MTIVPTLDSGVWPVMLTPFTSDKQIDFSGVDRLTDWYIESGASGLFSVCLSSEMYMLADQERIGLAGRVVGRRRRVGGRLRGGWVGLGGRRARTTGGAVARAGLRGVVPRPPGGCCAGRRDERRSLSATAVRTARARGGHAVAAFDCLDRRLATDRGRVAYPWIGGLGGSVSQWQRCLACVPATTGETPVPLETLDRLEHGIDG